MSDLEITEIDLKKVQTICEYLFFDEYKDCASYAQFEKSFKFFINREISLEDVFKEICGKKKKYVNFPRMMRSYLQYKTSPQKISTDLKKFFDIIFKVALKEPEVAVGSILEDSKKYTSGTRNSDCVTKIEILGDSEDMGTIQGLKLEYDDSFISRLYDKTKDSDYITKMDMSLGLLDEKKMDKKTKDAINLGNEFLFRDSITHIFGTFAGTIQFLGFKSISGKLYFYGNPVGEPFIFGKYGAKFNYAKVHILDGIVYFKPYFEGNARRNVCLKKEFYEIDNTFINEETEKLVLDEKILFHINESNYIKKLITTDLIEDDKFFDGTKDKIKGDKLEDVVSLEPRYYQIKGAKKKLKQDDLLAMDQILKDEPKKEVKKSCLLRGGRRKLKEDKPSQNKPFFLGSNRKRVANQKIDIPEQRLHPIKENWDGNSVKDINVNGILKSKKNYNKLVGKMENDIKKEIQDETGREMNSENKDFYLDYAESKKQEKEEKEKLKSSKRKLNKEPIVLKSKKLSGKPIEVKTKSKSVSSEPQPTKLRSARKPLKGKEKKAPKLKGSSYKIEQNEPFGSFIASDDDFWGYGNSYKYFDEEEDQEEEIDDEDDDVDAIDDFLSTIFGKAIENKNKREEKEFKIKELEEDPEADRMVQKNWKLFSEKLEKSQGVKIIQTIGSVINALTTLKRCEENDVSISKKEKIKLYKILVDNEKIVDFLATANEKKDEEVEEPKEEEEEKEVEINDDDLNENVEGLTIEGLNKKIASIEDLFSKTQDIDKQIKLNDLYNLYKRTLNILIEKEDKIAKENLIAEKNINVQNLEKEEEEKRQKALESQTNYIQQILNNSPGIKISKEESDEIAMNIQERLKKRNKQVDSRLRSRKNDVKASCASKPSANKIYKNQKMPKENETFTDDLFTPEAKSLCPLNEDGDWLLPEECIPEDIEGWDKIKWARVKEIFKTNDYSVFQNGISADDIIQGSLGDCYFLSAVAALTQKTDLIENLFYNLDKSTNNCYGVYLRINGEWKLVLLDDYVPYTGKFCKRFAFSSANGEELWMILLEKAWSKINGCFAVAGSGGLPHEVFDVITDAYSEKYAVKPENKDIMWEGLMKGYKNGYIMTCGTSGDGDIETKGLVPGHAYTIMGVYEVKDKNKKEAKILRIRNPWGSGEWVGDWDDQYDKWTPELRKKVGATSEDVDDGIFCMSYDDFIKYYVIIGICMLHPSYQSIITKVSKEAAMKPTIYKITIEKNNTHVYFQLYQKNPRIILNDGTYQKPVLAYLILANEKLEYVASTSLCEMTLCVEQTLNKGTYYIISDINYRYIDKNKIHGYNITAYSKEKIVFAEEQEINVYNAIKTTIKDYCRKNLEPLKQNGVTIYETKKLTKEFPFIGILFENKASSSKEIVYNVKKRGGKAFSIYCEETAKEEDTSLTKIIKPKGDDIIFVMPYHKSSLFSISYEINTIEEPIQEQEEEYPNDDDDEEVFKQDCQAIDEEESMWQYTLEERNDYIVGIWCKWNEDVKMKLVIKGFEFEDKKYKGKEEMNFVIKPGQKRVFRLKFPENYYGEFSFWFEFE